MVKASKAATSRNTSVVASVTSEAAPPITPASASGFSASAMTSIDGFSSYVSWLIASSVSPSSAKRTTTRPPASFAASKACVGWPVSISTRFVASTTLLTLRSFTASSSSTIHDGLGPTFTPRTMKPR